MRLAKAPRGLDQITEDEILTAFKNGWLIALALAAVLTLGLSACDDDDGDESESGTLQGDVSRTSVTVAMTAYRAEGLHDLDDEATTASEIGAGWSGSVERMHAVTVGTLWPEDLKPMAATLEDELQMTEDAIAAEDLKGTKEHIALAHAAWHDLEHDAYAYIGGEEHMEGESEDGGTTDDHGEESPEATTAS